MMVEERWTQDIGVERIHHIGSDLNLSQRVWEVR